MNSYFDFVFDHENLMIIIDNSHKVWFAANDIAIILGYKSPQKQIAKIIPHKYRKQYEDLNIHNKIYSRKYQNKTMFIDEVGLFRLSIKSKQPKAVKFQEWITDTVLPELRRKGTFELEKKVTKLEKRIKEITKTNKRMLSEIDYIRNIKYNPEDNIMYIIEVVTSYRGKKTKCYKLGITDDLKQRMATYKTGNTRVKLINSFKLENLDSKTVEHCAKATLKYRALKKNNEIYCTKLVNIYSIIQSCVSNIEELVGVCHGCKQKIKMGKFKKHLSCFD
jgi:prophage antirepressor-like protein